MSLVGQGWFPEAIETLLKSWVTAGVTSFEDITKQGTILPKSNLECKTKCTVPWMHYFQLRAALHSPALSRDLKKTLRILNDYCYRETARLEVNCLSFTSYF